MNINRFLGILLLAVPCTAWSQTPEDPGPEGEPVVITVSAQEMPESSVSASVTIISREMIEATRAEQVLDLLQESPFVHISQSGGAGGLATVTLRGGDPNFTLVLIDGIPVNDPTNLLGGSYDFSSLSIDQIERIEIVRGPLSSLYGSEAISGVIHIISRKGMGRPHLNLEARGGNFGSHEIRAGVEGESSNWRYGFSASYFDIDQEESFNTATRSTAAGNVAVRLGEESTLNMTARILSSDTSGFPENSGGPLFALSREMETADATESLVGLQYRASFFEIDADFFQHKNDSLTPAILDSVPPGFRSLPSFLNDSDFDRTRLHWTGFWKKGAWSGTAGVSFKRESGESSGLIADFIPSQFSIERDTFAAAGEVLLDTGNVHASFGLRIDAPENFDEEASPRVGITWVLPDTSTRFRASWGEGYKLPSFFALADPNIGNRNLLPERSRAWDIGLEQEFFASRVFLSASAFHNSFQDLIDFSAEEFRLVNRREVTTKGVELETRIKARAGLQLIGHVNYIDADIEDSTEPLRDRPKWRGGFGFDWRILERAQLRMNYTAVGERFDFQIPVPERTLASAYQTLDVAGSYDLSKEWTLFARIDNLLDRHYQEFVGFPNPGAYFRAGIRWNVGL